MNLIETLGLPQYTKEELTVAHREWRRDYKDDMSFNEYLDATLLRSQVKKRYPFAL